MLSHQNRTPRMFRGDKQVRSQGRRLGDGSMAKKENDFLMRVSAGYTVHTLVSYNFTAHIKEVF